MASFNKVVLVLALLICPDAMAQTNTPAQTNAPKPVVAVVRQNPGLALLANIENERARITARGGVVARKLEEDRRLLSLRQQAGKIPSLAYSRQDDALRAFPLDMWRPFSRKLP